MNEPAPRREEDDAPRNLLAWKCYLAADLHETSEKIIAARGFFEVAAEA
jgi:hypothetical protein